MARLLFLVLCASCAWSANALGEAEDASGIKKAIGDFLRIQIKGLPGTATFAIGNINPDSPFPPCQHPQVSFPKGSRPWGQTTVLVQCTEDSHWSRYVAVRVSVRASYVVAGRALSRGQTLAIGDMAQQVGDLTDLPPGTLTDPAQGVGRTVDMALAAGMPLRADMLKQPLVVQQGQTVKVASNGQGFQVSSEGQALNSASEGQVVKVRLPTGQIVSGLARVGGQVDITY